MNLNIDNGFDGNVWVYDADDGSVMVIAESGRGGLFPRRVISMDKLSPVQLRETSSVPSFFEYNLDQIQLAHKVYWDSEVWC